MYLHVQGVTEDSVSLPRLRGAEDDPRKELPDEIRSVAEAERNQTVATRPNGGVQPPTPATHPIGRSEADAALHQLPRRGVPRTSSATGRSLRTLRFGHRYAGSIEREASRMTISHAANRPAANRQRPPEEGVGRVADREAARVATAAGPLQKQDPHATLSLSLAQRWTPPCSLAAEVAAASGVRNHQTTRRSAMTRRLRLRRPAVSSSFPQIGIIPGSKPMAGDIHDAAVRSTAAKDRDELREVGAARTARSQRRGRCSRAFRR